MKHAQAQMKVELNEMKDKITGMERKQEKIKVRLNFFCVGVMYSGEYDACDVTLSVYPHRASLKNMPGHGGNRTYDLGILAQCSAN